MEPLKVIVKKVQKSKAFKKNDVWVFNWYFLDGNGNEYGLYSDQYHGQLRVGAEIIITEIKRGVERLSGHVMQIMQYVGKHKPEIKLPAEDVYNDLIEHLQKCFQVLDEQMIAIGHDDWRSLAPMLENIGGVDVKEPSEHVDVVLTENGYAQSNENLNQIISEPAKEQKPKPKKIVIADLRAQIDAISKTINTQDMDI